MGCAGSLENVEAFQHREKKSKKKEKKSVGEKGDRAKSPAKGGKSGGGKRGSSPTKKSSVATLSKEKYVGEVGALVQNVEKADREGVILVFVPQNGDGLAFSFRAKDGSLWACELNEAKLKHAKDSCGISFGWAAVFKSLASDASKGDMVLTSVAGGALQLEFLVRNTKAATGAGAQGEPFTVTLTKVASSPHSVNRLFTIPMIQRIQKARIAEDEAMEHVSRLELRGNLTRGLTSKYEKSKANAEKRLIDLRKDAVRAKDAAQNSLATIARLEAKRTALAHRLAAAGGVISFAGGRASVGSLDTLYDVGGAQYFSHLPFAVPHHPDKPQIPIVVCDYVALMFEQEEPAEGETEHQVDLNHQIFRRVLSGYPHLSHAEGEALETQSNQLWTLLGKLDDWDYNVFSVEDATKGNALFFTTYSILQKLQLPQHFELDDTILRRLLAAIQAGYHPNPYHNSTHAADVTHIMYYILFSGGFQDVCPLVQEEVLAAIIGACIHDYDHPGFNNNFHTRTNAYLSTLYNDRSILENHHLACVWEMMRHPAYNLFGKLLDDQRKEIRDTMTEMVLSTDMGIHGKILSQFQRRIQEGAQWSQRKEDLRLALAMAIKMADVSNSGRPTHIYTAWAKNIAAEFYDQGDVEQRLKLDVSPFMNRSRHLQDFARGQTSFMGFVIVPMFEAIIELLPNMSFVLEHAAANKEYWSTHTPGDLGALRRRISLNNSDTGSVSRSSSDLSATGSKK